MSELPKGWARASLDAVADVLDFEREPINSSERDSRTSGKPDRDLFPYYGATGQVGLIDSFRSEGERVLLGEDAAPFLDPSKGKAYLASGRFWVNNHAHVLFGASGMIDNRFLCYQLNVVDYHPYVTGSTRLKLTSAAMRQIPLMVAPAAEQTRIVAKLEELLSELDAGVAELKAAQKKLQQYRQSLLKAAVEGSLTASWRETQRKLGTPAETGAQLLQRILTERRARWEAKQLAKFKEQGKTPPKDWQKKYPEPVQPDITDLPELPEGWVWASVDQLTPDDLANGRSVPTADSGAKVLRLTSVRDGKIDLSESKCGAWTEEDASPFHIAEGDLLIVRGNGSLSLVGRAGLVGQVDEPVAYPDTLIRLRLLTSIIEPSWVAALWDSGHVRTHIEKRARTSAGIYKISQPDIVSTPVPVPPIQEQRAVIERWSTMKIEVLAGSSEIERSLHRSAAQRQNILRAAFAGQLVPQDPNDEPASVLLERIRAERASQAHGGKRRKRPSAEIT